MAVLLSGMADKMFDQKFPPDACSGSSQLAQAPCEVCESDLRTGKPLSEYG